MEHDPSNIPPPSQNETNLAIASITLHSMLFPVAVWIAWKHGKTGLVCWPIFASFFILRFLSDGWQISVRNEPDIPNAVSIFTNAGIITCLALGLIGVVYEAGAIFSPAFDPRINKALLGFTHLINTAGIGIATYGGSPNRTAPNGVASSTLDKVGHCLLLLVMLMLGGWLAWTGRCVLACRSHPNLRNAKVLLLTACIGLPFHTIRLVYAATYSFTRIPSLGSNGGAFTTRLFLMFLMEFSVAIVLTVGGWLTRNVQEIKAFRTRSLSLELVETSH